jgi:hypothetical protein
MAPKRLKGSMGHSGVPPSLDTYGHLFAQREDALVNALERRRRNAKASLYRGGDFLGDRDAEAGRVRRAPKGF